MPSRRRRAVDWYYPQLQETSEGRDVVEKLEKKFKRLKHDIL